MSDYYEDVTAWLEVIFEGVHRSYRWYAVDSDGRGHYYETEPFVDGDKWGWDGGSKCGPRHDMTAVADWKACLYPRPIEPTENDKEMFAAVETIAQQLSYPQQEATQ